MGPLPGLEANTTLSAFLIKKDCLEINELCIQPQNLENKKKTNLEKEIEK